MLVAPTAVAATSWLAVWEKVLPWATTLFWVLESSIATG
jgi:hypothetical protein